ncbi:MAG: hypothetical protein OXC92_02235 [Flavobacteriaceae bacterium]|nr:hypothetical protein [Flavobacteriaceae bacterium]MCY4297692.1 hypothetical protein [Flavobacteriaceae bacterium]
MNKTDKLILEMEQDEMLFQKLVRSLSKRVELFSVEDIRKVANFVDNQHRLAEKQQQEDAISLFKKITTE